jgi:DNA-binding NarL/FixJ family response regulator
VLVVDDHDGVLKLLVDAFRREGFVVETAEIGRRALALALEREYAALVLDLVLPDLSGLDVLTAVRRAGRRTPALVLTGHGTTEAAIETTRLGARYLEKTQHLGDTAAVVVATVLGELDEPGLSPPELFGADGPSGAARAFLVTLDGVEAFLRAVAEPDVREHLQREAARLAVAPDVTWAEFVVAARGFRTLTDLALSLPLSVRTVRTQLARAARQAWSDVDPIARAVLTRIDAAGALWAVAGEVEVSAALGIDTSTVWRHLRRAWGLNFPQVRQLVVLRRVVGELAGTNEQVAQVAYSAGYDQPSTLNDAFRRVFGVSPTIFRRLIRSDLDDVQD